MPGSIVAGQTPTLKDGSGTTSHVVTFASAPTSGNLIVLAGSIATAGANVTAPSGFTKLFHDNAGTPNTSAIIMYKIAGASEPTSYTVLSSGSTIAELQGYEWTGMINSAHDTTNNADATGTATVTCGSTGALTQADEVAIVACYAPSRTVTTENLDSGFTVRNAATFNDVIVGDLIVSATTALAPAASWTTNSASSIIIATFKATVASSAPERQMPRGVERGVSQGVS